MSQQKLSLGQAIDQIVAALHGLETHERTTAIDAACAYLKIPLGTPRLSASSEKAASTPAPSAPPHKEQVTAQPPAATDIRSLKEQKKPKSAREMACIVAFYLQEVAPEGEQKESVTTADLQKYFKQAQFALPGDIGQVLKNAKGAGYFDSPARGTYKLNAVGYNLVAHKLPSGTPSQ